ncbi:GNAT family N-acetyltransferase [Yoonia sp. 208BN28-4]|uniref:GNAT family N-acetyltransferase n=1 Tax=Yoonia sp. 208BN28-4 TaxID=3126505 RepID=UPI00309AAF32
MTATLRQTRYTARFAQTRDAITACQALRRQAFFGEEGLDQDAFDPLCQHLMIIDCATDQLVGTTRFAIFEQGDDLSRSYTAQSYDLTALHGVTGAVAEVGRFCLRDGPVSSDILRVAWAALTRLVDAHDVTMLFGCSSFAGTDPAPHAAALSLLRHRYLGPAHLRPARKADETLPLDRFDGTARDGLAQMPPLLASYLRMGGWVSDHAVVDHAMQTLHVFTGLLIADVPPARAKALRGLAQLI